MDKELCKKRARKIRLIAATVIASVVMAALILSIVAVVISHAQGGVPFLFGYSAVWIKSGSMEPTIARKSFILIEKTAPRDVAVGDVIVFVSDDPEILGERNTHRVTAIIGDAEAFVTRGDNRETNKADDRYPASAGKLVGRYVKTLPFLSVMGRFLSSAVGIFAVVLIFLLILMLLYLPDMARIVRQAERAKKEKAALMDDLVKKEIERLRAAEKEKGEDPASLSDRPASGNPPKTPGEGPRDGGA